MGSNRFPRILFALFAFWPLAAALMGEASAQEDAAGYPSKPIRIIVVLEFRANPGRRAGLVREFV